jgi:hypothetical protein
LKDKIEMDLEEFKKDQIRKNFDILPDKYPKIISFIDFANVNHWFDEDDFDENGVKMADNELLTIDLQKLKDFLSAFSSDNRFYYGHDPVNPGSLRFKRAAEHIFGKPRVFTKPIQQIKHYLDSGEKGETTRKINVDKGGNFIWIPKCNFDVEISVDSVRLINSYDTFCLLSSDADFAALIRFLKKQKKKIVLIKGGHIDASLGELVDNKINAQNIKRHIAVKKQKPDSKESGLAES